MSSLSHGSKLDATTSVAVIVIERVEGMVDLVRSGVVVVVVIVVTPVHESFSMADLMRHDRHLGAEALIVSGESISVDVNHRLTRYLVALESVDEVVEVTHHDDLGSTHLDQYVHWRLVSKLGPLPTLRQNEFSKALGVKSLVQLSLKLGELHPFSIVASLIAN